jgi:mono/diheme cytochrome c family protein
MMWSRRTVPGLVGIVVAACGLLTARLDAGGQRSESAASVRQRSTSPPSSSAITPPADLVKRYCVTCHNERLKTAGLTLDGVDVRQPGDHAEVWEKVVRKLRSGAMPPPSAPRPDRQTVNSFVSWIENELDRDRARKPQPGRAAIHRLNRAEYTNAIRDLLAVEIDPRSMLPGDDASYGFDNIADVLTISPTLLERYLSAARKIGRLAVGEQTARPVLQTYTLPRTLVQLDRMSDDLPFRSRGGAVIRHYFPADGEYAVRIRMQRALNTNVIRGLGNREQLDVRLDQSRLKLFAIGGECVGSAEPRCRKPPGLVQASDYERTADEGLEVRFAARAGSHALGIAFVRRSAAAPEGPGPVRLPAGGSADGFDQAADMSIDTIQVEGPFAAAGIGDTPSRRAIFICHPVDAGAHRADADACARTILARLARRAYRRPVTDPDVQTLVGFFRAGEKSGGFDAGIELAIERLLVAPEFLFRVESDPLDVPAGTPHRISDVELASRLSFFLWSSIPDDELLDVAARGRLKEPPVLRQQVTRMLADPRSQSLIANFAGQWLYFRNVASAAPDPDLFPDFDLTLRNAFQRETELFLASQLREDRSATELLTADYTFVNERLARFYGIPNVYGSHFRRVALPDDRRAGLLGQASILTVTSYATRTSPVVRGKWLLENILGSPPPPPPANVPPLKENGEAGAAPASVRQRLEEHRKNPVCASCHVRMDPLGFALENFDAIGQWRTTETNVRIDPSGTFPDGTRFTGPAEFRRVLVNHREQFVATLTEKLMTYALGRGVEYFDMPAIRSILREAAPRDYRWSSLILGIVNSQPFQMRTAPEAPREQSSRPAQAREH